MLVLVVAKGYLSRLLRNEAIAAYLKCHYAELLEELQTIMEVVTSDARQLEIGSDSRRYPPQSFRELRNPQNRVPSLSMSVWDLKSSPRP